MKIKSLKATFNFVAELENSVLVLTSDKRTVVTVPLEKKVVVAKSLSDQKIRVVEQKVVFPKLKKFSAYLVAYDRDTEVYVVREANENSLGMILSEFASFQAHLQQVGKIVGDQLSDDSEFAKALDALSNSELLLALGSLMDQVKIAMTKFDLSKVVREVKSVKIPEIVGTEEETEE